MIAVEIVFQTSNVLQDSNQCVRSKPLDATKEEFLAALESDPYVDFPIQLQNPEGIGTFCISTEQIKKHCFLIFREVE